MDTIKKTITVETLISRPLETVWENFTKPEHITNWNFASEDWSCPSAEIDLRENGRFSYRMEAKDQSTGFNFCGRYQKIQKPNQLHYVLDDGRQVEVNFERLSGGTKIVETFEAEDQNPLEQQRSGWQAILDNLKKYTESM